MTTKFLSNEDSIVGYNKKVDYTISEYDSDEDYDDEDHFYDNYEPYEEEFDNGEYQVFDPVEEEREHQAYISPRSIKIKRPCMKINSPTKSDEKSPSKSPSKSPTWWDKNITVKDIDRIVNGVLNYGALLPPPTMSKIVVPSKKSKKSKKSKQDSKTNGQTKPSQQNPKTNDDYKKPQTTTEVPKPTRFCLSVIKKTKCFHGTQCRFAHDYGDLKECNFGEKCKKIIVVKANPDGTLELKNKSEVTCSFKHAKESQASYLKRVPQQHTSPKK